MITLSCTEFNFLTQPPSGGFLLPIQNPRCSSIWGFSISNQHGFGYGSHFIRISEETHYGAD